ncbi:MULTISPECIES: endospore germination permease [Paenibacillus]|uniref:Spore germination protein n=2 Tax=Paenibacillus lactis TaxID=228574 RepID=G4H8Q6_9BACL|nr:endospore germination permease [Paenibacillus lactis]EHB68241.1 spore germination protein [Paenibacillus lactis 154]MBP1894194.1 spore germination protein KB [Paenibacillus lactis]MCM3497131.1 endospore germination permease [Paenibacillus lactis]HAF99625.1 spore gernimation protein [Paenibacillus lactis]
MHVVKISLRQVSILTALYTIGSAILIVPSGMASIAKQDAWIACLAGSGLGFIILAVQLQLFRKHPEANLMQWTEKLFGKWIGKTVNLLLLLTLFLGGPATVLHEIGIFMTIQMLPETPIQAIIFLFGALAVLGVRLGLEVLARAAEMLFPWFLLLFLSMSILLLSEIHWEHATPILESGISPIFPAALSFVSIAFLPHIVLMVIFPGAVNRSAEAYKAVYIGSLVGAAALFLIIGLSILVLGPDITARNMYPSYMLAKKINIGNFLQRIEAVMAVMWFITLFFRISLYFYAIAIGISQVFHIKNYQPLVMPLGWILAAVSVFIYPNVPFKLQWDATIWVPYTITVGFLFPLVLLILHGLRKMLPKKSKKQSDSA